MKKTICFAYFGDGKFIGWYSDSFGTITKQYPKIYSHSEEQVKVVRNNFEYKLSKFQEDPNFRKFNPGLAVLDSSLVGDAKELSQYSAIELRIVECPIYDGPNPNFDKERHKNWRAYDRKPMFEPENRDWIYADSELVKTWALQEPTEFMDVVSTCYLRK